MKVTKQQLQQLIKEEMLLKEDITDDYSNAEKKYQLLVQNIMKLLKDWQPSTAEGRLYKQQLDDASTVTEGR